MCRLTVTKDPDLRRIRIHLGEKRPVSLRTRTMAFLIDHKQGIPAGMLLS
jgi:hypothetical protein